ncbi:FtsX-like permease family protein [Actinoplanes sp. NPDC051861]|uniref:FtsX-like permease family protein n=1 Tax=Actinoplanes sp. NPDC051861 TaxID=3155170 RepID=UPI003433E311
MLTLLGGRTRAQWQLLVSLLAVVTVGATLLGVCALLVTRTGDRALEEAASRAVPEDVEVTAYTVTIGRQNARSVYLDTRQLLIDTLTPFAASTAGRASSVMRHLPGSGTARAYLSGVDDLPERAALTAGRWPRAAGESVVLESTARQLNLRPGRRVQLGEEAGRDPAPPIAVTVVGVVRPLAGAGWDRDILEGAGYDPAFSDGGAMEPYRAYGPFLLPLDELLVTGSAITRLEITARPDLSDPDGDDLTAVTRSVGDADARLARILGDRIEIERVASRWPATMVAARDQQQVTNGAVLAIAVLGLVLTGTALALAGRLTAEVRAGETALLSAMGTSTARFALVATAEAGALALVASAIAIPGSAMLHSALTRLQPLAGAGLAAPPAPTATQVVTVLAGAAALAVLLVVRAIRPATPAGDRTRRDLLARSGADLLLVALAVGGWWQLRSQPGGSDPRVDTVRVLAPALLLTAGAALALRLVPPALAAADRLARRAGGLSLPLAIAEAARRPQATAAGLLITLACAAATFGVAFDATWTRSQHDQADLAVGTDLALTLATAPTAGQGEAVRESTGGTVSPVADRGMSVGQWLGGNGEPPRMVAIDTARAGQVLRGRLDSGRDWASVGAALAAPAGAPGIEVAAGADFVFRGTASADLMATPRFLIEDSTGLRAACSSTPLPLDGRAHRISGCAPMAGLRMVGVTMPISGNAISWDAFGSSAVSATVTVPGTAPAQPWTAGSAPPEPEQLLEPTVELTPDGAATSMRLTATVQLGGPQEASARELVATAFTDPGPVPVVISERFASEVSAAPGDNLNVSVDTTSIPVVVKGVVPAVPSAPGVAAVLADIDTLSRALIMRGELDYPIDAWWVGNPAGDGADLHLGPVATRTGEITRLSSGPVPSVLPAALRLLVPAALALLLAGILLHVTCDLRARAVEVARLRGLGMTRREVRRTLLGQHAVLLLPMVLAGALVGALGTRLVAPFLIRSATGAAPVPDVVPVWPWLTETGLVLLLLAVCSLSVSLVVVVQASRADAAHLRVTS